MHAIVAIRFARFLYHGGLAQMVERELCMREVAGSNAGILHKKIFC